jgi:hypothetical protein
LREVEEVEVGLRPVEVVEGISIYNHESLETILAANQRLKSRRKATNREAVLKIFFITNPNPILVSH